MALAFAQGLDAIGEGAELGGGGGLRGDGRLRGVILRALFCVLIIAPGERGWLILIIKQVEHLRGLIGVGLGLPEPCGWFGAARPLLMGALQRGEDLGVVREADL